MKTFIIYLIFSASQFCFGEGQPENVAIVLDLVQASLTSARSNSAAVIAFQAGPGPVDLVSLVKVLNQADEALARAALEKKLQSAHQRVEATRDQLASLITPERELDMDISQVDGLNQRIILLRTQEDQLRRDIESLRKEITNLLTWKELMEPVLAADQLSQRLKNRLHGLIPILQQPFWPDSSTATPKVANRGQPKLKTSLGLSPGTIKLDQPTLSPAVAEILDLTQLGVGENELLARINQTSNLFELSPDQLIFLHGQRLSTPILTAMLTHDRALESLNSKGATRVGLTIQRQLPPAFHPHQ